jgi:hypothetical protein
MALKSKLIFFVFLSCVVFPGVSAAAFNDVPDNYWAKDAVDQLTSLGVLIGFPDGSFHPNAPVNRSELTTILARLKLLTITKVAAPPFPDVPPQFWASGYIAAAAKSGLIIGYPDRSFRPTMPLDRVDAIVTIVRLEEMPETFDWKVIYKDVSKEHWAVKEVFLAKQAGFLDYIKGDVLDPARVFTRGEACWMLARTKIVKARLKK